MYLNSNLLLLEQLACIIRMDIIMPDGISKIVCVRVRALACMRACVCVCVHAFLMYIPLTCDITTCT